VPPSNSDPDQALDELREALESPSPERIKTLAAGLSAARLADLLESLEPGQRGTIWSALDAGMQGRVLIEAHREVREQLIDASSPAQLAAAVQNLDLDQLSDIDDALPADVVDAVLRSMDSQRRERFELIRGYDDDTAGGLMDADAIAVRPDITLAMVLGYLALVRAERGRLPEELDAVEVVDRGGHYLGRLPLTDLVSLGVGQKVHDVMATTLAPIDATLPAARVARWFEDHNLVSAPVIDADGVLVGRIKVDNVLDYVRAEADRAALAAAGLDEGADTFAPALRSARSRGVWLGINLVNALLAAAVIGLFDATIERLVALAILMPVVSSMGGGAGTQSLALMIRGLALEQVNRANQWRLLRRELTIALINGVVWSMVVGALAQLWFGKPGLSLVFGAAILINLVAGVAMGTLIPLLLEKLRVDAAIAGQVVLVAFTDTFGFFVFLGMAALTIR